MAKNQIRLLWMAVAVMRGWTSETAACDRTFVDRLCEGRDQRLHQQMLQKLTSRVPQPDLDVTNTEGKQFRVDAFLFCPEMKPNLSKTAVLNK